MCNLKWIEQYRKNKRAEKKQLQSRVKEVFTIVMNESTKVFDQMNLIVAIAEMEFSDVQ